MVLDVEFRRALSSDREEILGLLSSSLDWGQDAESEGLFHWKHRENPFGPSGEWVATSQGRIIGYRSFLRWEFVDSKGFSVKAVRAVDTVTATEFRGRGIFRALTAIGVQELAQEGCDLIFNTPNRMSAPGYLGMGWSAVGRLRVSFAASNAGGLARLAANRGQAAAVASVPTRLGEEADVALQDDAVLCGLLRHSPGSGFRTLRTSAYMTWRYSPPSRGYRLGFVSDRDYAEGGAVFRLRQRGGAKELAIVELFVPTKSAGKYLVRRLQRRTGADYAIMLQSGAADTTRNLPWHGPLLVARGLVSEAPNAREWNLALGDIELL